MNANELWNRYKKHLCRVPAVGLSLDISRMSFDDGVLRPHGAGDGEGVRRDGRPGEGGDRQPGREPDGRPLLARAPELAPEPAIPTEIRDTLAAVKAFAAKVHSGEVKPQKGAKFTQLLSIGIGGSALGPMFVADALGGPAADKLKPYFVDNTDPDGIARELARLGGHARRDPGRRHDQERDTPETRNGMLVVAGGLS